MQVQLMSFAKTFKDFFFINFIMWTLALLLLFWVAGLCMVRWIYRWRNPKCNGILPPGSMGLPFLGETLHLIVSTRDSFDLHPFFKKRLQRYGSIFRTNIMGQPVVLSADPEVNKYMIQHEGKEVQIWFTDSFAKLFALEGESNAVVVGRVHKYVRTIILTHFGIENLKGKLIPQLEDLINSKLLKWTNQGTFDVKLALSSMIFNFNANYLFGYDAENSEEKIREDYLLNFLKYFLSFPLYFRGSSLYKCMQDKGEMVKLVKDVLKKRLIMSSNSKSRNESFDGKDFLDDIIKDMEKENFLTEDFISKLIVALCLVTFESVSVTLTLAFKFLAENPLVLEELTAEHEEILEKKDKSGISLTWDECRSMTFTHQVINEVLRLSNSLQISSCRKSMQDIHIKGYTIPKGWNIMLIPTVNHLNPKTFEDPLAFNPWRWKGMDPQTISKDFMPFGGGSRQCVGADFSKTFMAVFLHVLVTKFRWTKMKGGRIIRNPILGFPDGLYIKMSPK